jgi:hypothetical protein
MMASTERSFGLLLPPPAASHAATASPHCQQNRSRSTTSQPVQLAAWTCEQALHHAVRDQLPFRATAALAKAFNAFESSALLHRSRACSRTLNLLTWFCCPSTRVFLVEHLSVHSWELASWLSLHYAAHTQTDQMMHSAAPVLPSLLLLLLLLLQT